MLAKVLTLLFQGALLAPGVGGEEWEAFSQLSEQHRLPARRGLFEAQCKEESSAEDSEPSPEWSAGSGGGMGVKSHR